MSDDDRELYRRTDARTEPRRLTLVWADTIRHGFCRDAACGARLTFAQNVRTGNVMPFSGELVALRTDTERETGRVMWQVDLRDAHFATCPGAAGFRSKRK